LRWRRELYGCVYVLEMSHPALYLDVGERQAQGKSRLALHLSRHLALERVWSFSELVMCYVAPIHGHLVTSYSPVVDKPLIGGG
jgi:hypothetical protein